MKPIYTRDRFKREALVKKLLKDNRSITVENIIMALGNDIPESKISQEVINLCKEIIKNPVTLSLPIPKGENVYSFSRIAGPEHGMDKKIAGCYRIFSEFYKEDYVGHSTKLGKRVKDHAKGKEFTTKKINKFKISIKNGFLKV